MCNRFTLSLFIDSTISSASNFLDTLGESSCRFKRAGRLSDKMLALLLQRKKSIGAWLTFLLSLDSNIEWHTYWIITPCWRFLPFCWSGTISLLRDCFLICKKHYAPALFSPYGLSRLCQHRFHLIKIYGPSQMKSTKLKADFGHEYAAKFIWKLI